MNKELTLEEKFNKVIELLKNRLIFEYISGDREIDEMYPPNKERGDIRASYMGLNLFKTQIEKENLENILKEVAPETIEEANKAKEYFKKEGYKEYEGIHTIVV